MLKELLFTHCKNYIETRHLLLEKQKSALQLALTSESKSSAGDKHETGRAMIQLEREKLGNQIAEVERSQQKLNALKNYKNAKIVSLGSVVFTDTAKYYIAIAADPYEFESNQYFCISAQSPIGALLMGKKVNNTIQFNEHSSTILEII